MKVLCLLGEGTEDIELVTVVDLMVRGGIECFLACVEPEKKTSVKLSRGVQVVPDGFLIDMDQNEIINSYDGIFCPGGPNSKRIYAADKWVFSICAAPAVLSQSGLFENKSITCYPDEGLLKMIPGHTKHSPEESVLIDGKFISSKGPGTALSLGKAIIAVLVSKEKSEQVAKAACF